MPTQVRGLDQPNADRTSCSGWVDNLALLNNLHSSLRRHTAGGTPGALHQRPPFLGANQPCGL